MEKLYFATTNKGKFRTMQRYFEKMGAPFKLEQTLLDLVEIQSDNMGEIAVAKAAEAQAQLQEPVIVDDSGLFIEALNGFPGAYSKHAEQTLGAKGILKLLEGQENRNCIFHNALALADSSGNILLFEDNTSLSGKIAEQLDDTPCDDVAWSDYWRIFIPNVGQHEKPLSAFSPEELESYYKEREQNATYANLVRFLKEEQKAA